MAKCSAKAKAKAKTYEKKAKGRGTEEVKSKVAKKAKTMAPKAKAKSKALPKAKPSAKGKAKSKAKAKNERVYRQAIAKGNSAEVAQSEASAELDPLSQHVNAEHKKVVAKMMRAEHADPQVTPSSVQQN
eukprot:s514_g4.t1